MNEALAGRRIGFLGGGAMGEALLGGLLASGVPADALAAADPAPERRRTLAERLGVTALESNAELVARSDVVVLAVKPGVLDAALRELGGRDAPALGEPLWISVAAGVPLGRLARSLPAGARIVRAMPNTPALVRAGATALAANDAATPDDRALARALFEGVGLVWEAPREALLDAVTGLSGSGPAYVFVLLEALGDAAVRMGLPRDAASRLAAQTVYGAARLVLETGRHPGDLKDQVTSPGGTTVAALERLEAHGFRAALHAAVQAATHRSRDLGED